MTGAIVVAGGIGERFGGSSGKQLASVAGLPLVSFALTAVARASSVEAVVLVCHPERVHDFRHIAQDACGEKLVAVVQGGDTRADSVRAGLAALPPECDVVVIHDGARPLVEAGDVDLAVAALVEAPEVDGVVVGHPATDTVKVVRDGHVSDTPPRESLWLVHTPQVFHMAALLSAHRGAVADGFEGTDDAALVEHAGGEMLAVQGPKWNVKVTVREDLAVVEGLLAERRAAP